MLGQGFRGTAAVQNILRDFIPMPASAVAAGIDEQSFYNCLDCYPEYVEEIDFDPAAMADALDEVIVTPMREAETLFSDYPFLTRMTSSMSPDEMTLDPYFVQNADMGEVSNQSMADLVIDCTDGSTYSEANRKIVLRDGREILGPPESWFWDSGTTYAEFAEGLDATNALVIEKTSASGLPELLTDNSSLVDDAIDNHNDRVRDLLGLEGGETGAGCGCSSSNGMATGVWPAALLMLLGLGRRRR
jgi:MYXO-CTERM domain-containing protein